ncbi:hypothetical protein [Bacillus litorisediminis]|nr:hypothetical protein [Bacillus litorisediminis]
MKKVLSGIILVATIFALSSFFSSSEELAGGGNLSLPPAGSTMSTYSDF